MRQITDNSGEPTEDVSNLRKFNGKPIDKTIPDLPDIIELSEKCDIEKINATTNINPKMALILLDGINSFGNFSPITLKIGVLSADS